MQFKSALLLPAMAVLATACTTSSTATKPKTTSSWTKPTSTSTFITKTKTSSAPATTTTAGFLNQCENFGISILDCTQLLNIAALNGNTIDVGGSAAPSSSSTPVDNGLQFVNACKNYGISIADCAKLLNLAILNGNTIDIDLSALTSIISALGLSPTVLSSLSLGIPTSGLVTLPTITLAL